MKPIWNLALVAGLSTLAPASAIAQLAAFPGALGFGASATGGRTGTIYHVTNLNDSGTGSFRDAVSQPNRIVVFDVGGNIDIASPITAQSNLTILGQTAPGGGIGVYGAEVSFYGRSNDIVRYMRFRDTTLDPGGTGTGNSSGNDVNLGNTSNIILDHVSCEFASYNNVDASGTTGANNLTVQNSIIANPIPSQQFNFHWEGTQGTFINNIFANAHNRSILGKGNLQFVNNSVYNYQAAFTTGNSGGKFSFDILNNYFVAGPSTSSASDDFYQVDTNQTAYATGNLLDGSANGTLSGSSDNSTGATVVTTPWSSTTATLPLLSATASYAWNEAHAGDSITHDPTTFAASLGYDQVDQEVVANLQSNGTTGRLYNTQTDTGLSNGGLGVVATGSKPTDTDGDGIPDSWEIAHGMNASNAADAVAPNPLGYMMIEQYANQLADSTLTTRVLSVSGGNWATASSWGGAVPGVYDIASIQGNGTGGDSVVTVNSSSSAPYVYQLNIGATGGSAGEKVVVSSGTLAVIDTITVGNLNTGTLEIDGGTVIASNVVIGNSLYGVTYNGTLGLNGGTLQTSNVVIGGGTPGHWTSGGSIAWSGGTLQAAGTLVVNAPATLGAGGGILDTNGNTATLSGIMSGAGPFTKIGAGVLTVTSANTYTGVTTIRGGTLSATALANGGLASSLGTSSNAAANLVLDGGALAGVGSTDRTFTLTANGGTLDNSGGLVFTGNGTIAVPANANVTLTLTGTNTGHETFSPAIVDAGGGFVTSVVKSGTGKWTFNVNGNKTYSGDTDITAGTLETLATKALSPNSNVVISAGAALDFHEYNQVINGLSGAGIVTDSFDKVSDYFTIGQANGGGMFSGDLGNGSLPAVVKDGSGTQILAGTDTYTGTTTVNGGVLQFNLAAGIGGSGVSVTVASGATAAAGYAIDQPFIARITTASLGTAALAFNSSNNLDYSTAGANLPNLTLGAVGSETYTGTFTPYGTSYRLGGGGGNLILPNTNALTGTDSVIVSGAGSTVSVTGTNSYSGITTIGAGAKLYSSVLTNGGVAGGLGTSSNAAANLIIDGGILAGAGNTDRLFTLTANGGTLDNSGGVNFTNTGPVSLPTGTNVTLTLTGSNTGHETFSPTLADPAGGFVTSVTKTGTGKWTFNVTGDKTYSGDTDVNAGTLETLAGNALSANSNMVIAAGAFLDFHDSSQTINGLSGAGSVVNNFVTHTDTFTIGFANGSGTFTGTINSGATLNLVKAGTGTETLTGVNTFTGNTTVNGGTLTIGPGGSITSANVTAGSGAILNVNGSLAATASVFANGTVNFGANAGTTILDRSLTGLSLGASGRVNVFASGSQVNRTVVATSGLLFSGTIGNWQGLLDLSNNDLGVANASLANIDSQIMQGYSGGTWLGSGGMISSTAAGNSSYLTTLGAIQNSVTGLSTGAALYGSGTTLGLFDGLNPGSTDVLVKYTYYGDANLDGQVDGSDYTRIDNGFSNHLTGWFNGDFNYDGVVDGSDYTLIDNAFNAQGASIGAQGTQQLATVTSSLAIPEPATCGLVWAVCGVWLGKRRRC